MKAVVNFISRYANSLTPAESRGEWGMGNDQGGFPRLREAFLHG